MIRKAHVGHVELRDLDAVGVEHEIELLARIAAGIGGQSQAVRALEPRGLHEQEDLVVAPERIEVAGDDHRLAGALHQFVQVAQLIVAMAELE